MLPVSTLHVCFQYLDKMISEELCTVNVAHLYKPISNYLTAYNILVLSIKKSSNKRTAHSDERILLLL